MKKSILIILALVLVFSSCAPQKTDDTTKYKFYRIKEGWELYNYGYNDDNMIRFYKLIKGYNYEDKYDRPEAPRSIEIEFNGKNYSGDYYGSFGTKYYQFRYDEYKSDDCFFSINYDTNRISSFSKRMGDYYSEMEEQQAKKLSDEELLKIVNDFLYQYVDGFSEYKFLNRNLTYASSQSDREYYYTFNRVMDEIKTSDAVGVGISVYGDITSYSEQSPGHMADAKLPSDEEMLLLEEGLDDFLKSVHKGYVHSYEYEVDDITFARLYDGRYAMIYKVTVKVRETENDEMEDHVNHYQLLAYV